MALGAKVVVEFEERRWKEGEEKDEEGSGGRVGRRRRVGGVRG